MGHRNLRYAGFLLLRLRLFRHSSEDSSAWQHANSAGVAKSEIFSEHPADPRLRGRLNFGTWIQAAAAPSLLLLRSLLHPDPRLPLTDAEELAAGTA